MIAVSSILKAAGHVLNDEDHDRWTISELTQWVRYGVYQVVVFARQAGARQVTVELNAGAYHVIPDCIQVLDVIRNTNGRPVTQTNRTALDSANPDWMTMRPGKPRQFTYDERLETAIYTYPPAAAGTELDVVVSRAPEVNQGTTEIDMPEEYEATLVDYVLFRAFAKDSEYANGAIASSYLQSFSQALGLNSQQTASVSANAARNAGQ